MCSQFFHVSVLYCLYQTKRGDVNIMKFRILSGLLCLILLFSLAGCGNETVSTPESSISETTQEAFGNMSLVDAPIQEAQTTALPGSATEPELTTEKADVSIQDTTAQKTADVRDFTEQAVTAVIICDALDMLEYTPEDSMYLWRSVGYLIGQIGTDTDLITMEGDFGKVSQEAAPIFAAALNADFDGTMPSVTEEDPLISMAEDGGYLINMLDQGNLVLEMTTNRIGAETDTVTEEATLFQNGESLGTYTVTLKATAPDSAVHNYFAYCITNLAPAE